MKVTLVGTGRSRIPQTGSASIERFITRLGENLQHAGAEVSIVNEIRPGQLTRGWRFERHLPFLLRERDTDIIHAHTSRAGLMLGLSSIPYVYTSHTPHWLLAHNPLQGALFERERLAVRLAQATIALTGRLEERIAEVHCRRGPVVRIPIAVDTDLFRPRSTGDPRIVLGIGAIEVRKRWHLAARALRGIGVDLRIVGPVRDRAYADQIRQEGAFLLGEVSQEEVLRELERCGVVVHPALGEAFSQAVLEGMAFFRPVICGPTMGHIPGALCAPTDDEDTVVEFIRKWATIFLSDDAQRIAIGRAARTVVEQAYSWPAVVKAHIALYERVRRRSL